MQTFHLSIVVGGRNRITKNLLQTHAPKLYLTRGASKLEEKYREKSHVLINEEICCLGNHPTVEIAAHT